MTPFKRPGAWYYSWAVMLGRCALVSRFLLSGRAVPICFGLSEFYALCCTSRALMAGVVDTSGSGYVVPLLYLMPLLFTGPLRFGPDCAALGF